MAKTHLKGINNSKRKFIISVGQKCCQTCFKIFILKCNELFMEKNFPEKINVSPLLTELINQIPLTEKTSFKFSKINEYNNLCLKSKM